MYETIDQQLKGSMNLLYSSNADAVLGALLDSKLLIGLKEFIWWQRRNLPVWWPNSWASWLRCRTKIAIGEGLPSLPKKPVEKILAVEFIDFTNLPRTKGKWRPSPQQVKKAVCIHLPNRKLQVNPRPCNMDTVLWDLYSYHYVKGLHKESAVPDTYNRWLSWAVTADTGLKHWSKVDPSADTQCFMGISISLKNWCKSWTSVPLTDYAQNYWH